MWIDGHQEGVIFKMTNAGFRLMPNGEEICIPLDQSFVEIHALSVGARNHAFEKMKRVIDGLLDGQIFDINKTE